MEKVSKYTRASTNGKLISCPKCKNQERVYHFNWCGLQCGKCKEMIDKPQWNIVSVNKSSKINMNVNLTKEEIRLISKSLLNQKFGKREMIVAMDIFEKIEIEK